ncbi:MAG: hypothetical protein ACFCD0_15945 [Gemmataceae bacterium]
MKHLFTVAFISTCVLNAGFARADDEDQQLVREALEEFNVYIGEWKGHGSLPTDKLAIWKENAYWGWKFKGNDRWLHLTVKNGKVIKGGDLKYDLDKDEYIFTATTKDKKSLVFRGKRKRTRLTLENTDPKTKEVKRIEMLIAGGGIRFLYRYKVKPPNRTFYSEKLMVAFTKKGEALGARKRGPECVVTGGRGTMAVSYDGKTYYVCCSGCRDAFNANPAKIIAEYKKRKRGGN